MVIIKAFKERKISMKKKIKRIISLVLTLIFVASLGMTSKAADVKDDGKILVTEQIAIDMAERFAKGAKPELDLSAGDPVKFYDTSGQAIGYIVSYYLNSEKYGYVIFDTTDESLISEYSFAKNAKAPNEIIKDTQKTLRNYTDNRLFRIAPFTYGYKVTDGNFINNYGEIQAIDVQNISDNKTRNADKPGHWEDIMLDIADVYQNYQHVSGNTISEFVSFTEEEIEQKTGRYACAVSALTACAGCYNILNWGNIKSDYLSLWSLTGTTTSSTSGSIIYGSTEDSKIGPGFQKFAKNKGKTITYSSANNPSYSFFTNTIDRGDVGIFAARLKLNDGSLSGHAMAVQGYAKIRKLSNGSTINTLMIYDGWYLDGRFLNINYAYYNSFGVSFNG